MRRRFQRRALGLGGLVLLGALALPSSGAPAAPARRAPKPPAPLPGLITTRVRFEPLDDDVTGALAVDGVGQHRGTFEIVPSGGGVAVINELGFEEYLYGISEVPVSWPAEAQRAQAIAARTYALHELSRPLNTAARAIGADICATDACQVYAGLAKEQREGAAAWTDAVRSTAGQVLLYNDKPVLAKYSSSSGGRSVSGGQPYLRSIPDPDDARSPLHRWQARFALHDVGRAVGVADPRSLRRVGDAVAIRSTNDGGEETDTVLTRADFRARLNANLPAPPGMPLAVPSMRFDVGFQPGEAAGGGLVVVDGRGWGHGIGMSQYGALGKALRGMKAADILAAYYSGIRPVLLPPERLPATLRVALDLGRAEAVVRSAGRFRVVDGEGRPLAIVASGAWRVVPAKGGVRVIPPEGHAGPPAVAAASEPTYAGATEAPGLRLSLSEAAVVSVTVEPPGLPPTALAPQVLQAGESLQVLPRPAIAGDYRVTVHAEAGVGRVASVPLTFRVDESRAAMARAGGRGMALTPVDPSPHAVPPAAIVALLLLVAVATAAARAAGTR